MRRMTLRCLLAAVVCVELAALAGCGLGGGPGAKSKDSGQYNLDDKVKEWIGYAGESMDRVARGLEEFGSVSVSSPLLAPATNFSFEVDHGPNDYFNEAKSSVQGRVAVLDQSAQQTSVGVKVQGDINALLGGLDQLAAYREELGDYESKRRLTRHAARLRAQQVTDALPPNATPAQRAAAEEQAARILLEESPGSATTRPAYPATAPTTLPSTDADLLPSPDKALGVLNGAQFTGIRGLLGSDSSTALANRAALKIAAGDTATEAIFSLLGSPDKYIPFKDKRILFGAGMVGVTPGWRTRTGYAADVSVTVEFTYVPARKEYRDAWLNEARRQLDDMAKKNLGDPEWAALKKLLEDVRDAAVVTAAANPTTIAVTSAPPPYGGGAAGGTPAKGRGAPERSINPLAIGAQPFSAGPGYTSPAAAARTSTALNIAPRFRVPSVPPSPLVSAVAPMTDSEVLDLGASVRQQRAFALAASLALRFSGLGGQAAVFDQWAKRLESDTVTRGAATAVSTYSNSGGMFGFQVGPRLRAVGAGGTGKRPELTLDRDSFPVLIIVGLDAADLEPRFMEADGQLTAFEPVIVFRQSMRWLPLRQPRPVERERDNALRAVDPGRYDKVLDYNGLQRGVREGDRLNWASSLDLALEHAPHTSVDWRRRLDRIADAQYALEFLKASSGKPAFAPTDGQRAGLHAAEELLLDPDPDAKPKPASAYLQQLVTLNRTLADGVNGSIQDAAVTDLLGAVKALFDAQQGHRAGVFDGAALQAARGRLNMLTYHAIGSSNWQYLPLPAVVPQPEEKKPPKLTVSDAGTLHGFGEGPSRFVIGGENMKDHIAQVILSPQGPAAVKDKTVLDGAVVVDVEVTDDRNAGGSPVDLYFITDKGASFHAAKLVFDLPPQADEEEGDPGVRVEYDDAGRPTHVSVNGRDIVLSPGELAKLLQALHRNDPNVHFGADAGGGFHVEMDGAGPPPRPPGHLTAPAPLRPPRPGPGAAQGPPQRRDGEPPPDDAAPEPRRDGK